MGPYPFVICPVNLVCGNAESHDATVSSDRTSGEFSNKISSLLMLLGGFFNSGTVSHQLPPLYPPHQSLGQRCPLPHIPNFYCGLNFLCDNLFFGLFFNYLSSTKLSTTSKSNRKSLEFMGTRFNVLSLIKWYVFFIELWNTLQYNRKAYQSANGIISKCNVAQDYILIGFVKVRQACFCYSNHLIGMN